jgi:catechol 2,3-dioxygenase-like lactoylglutathione lyase family enzyme
VAASVAPMEQRVSLITLGVADLERSRWFYEQLGWRGREVERTVFFQAGAMVVVLWGRDDLARDAGITDDAVTIGAITGDRRDGFGGIALAHNVRSRAEVDEVLGAAGQAGATVTRPSAETFYGGYAGWFADPDGHLWEVAHNPGFHLGDDGAITLPDFGQT